MEIYEKDVQITIPSFMLFISFKTNYLLNEKSPNRHNEFTTFELFCKTEFPSFVIESKFSKFSPFLFAF